MAVREGKWRCPACDQVNLGRDMKCSACGTVRGEDVEFFLDEDAQAVEDQAQLDQANAGADWHCDFCGTDNRAGQEKCRQCGAPAEGMRRRQQSTQNSPGQPGAISEAGTAPSPAPRKKSKIFPIMMAMLAIIAGVITVFFLRGEEDNLVLHSAEWSRTIEVEQQEWVNKEAWYDQLPSDADILRTWEEQRSTERIQVGTETVKTGTRDMGNGYFEDVYEEQPVYEERAVYDTRVEYRVREWKAYREVTAQGTLEDRPIWPEPNLGRNDREGQRHETAVLYFESTDSENDGQLYSYDRLTPDEISSFHQNQEYQAVVAGDRVRRFLEE